MKSSDFLALHNIAYNANSNIDPMFGASEIKKLADESGVVDNNIPTWSGKIMDFNGDAINNNLSHLENPLLKK